MPETLLNIIETLEELAAYTGPWKALREEAAALARETAELRERAERLDDVLVVALVGGSGVGKSTLLNAIAGDTIAETSPMRPCTRAPMVYHPPELRLPFGGWQCVPRSALRQLALLDTPDSDTVVHQHRELAIEVLRQCDLIVLCASAEKYLDEDTWSLLRPLQGQRTMICVETKASEQESIREHWLQRLRGQGFEIAGYFRVNALHSLDRKLPGGGRAGDEYDFHKLEAFLRHELTQERIARIKQSNAAGLLLQVVSRLNRRAEAAEAELKPLAETVHQADAAMARLAFQRLEHRLFAAPHLWNFAFGREVSLRAKGIMGALFRLAEAVRSLPAWLPGVWPGRNRAGGQQAAALLTGNDLLDENLELASEGMRAEFQARQSELALEFTRAGIDPPGEKESLDHFVRSLNTRLASVLRGPARDRLVHAAAGFTAWPIAFLLDLPIAAFILLSSYRIVFDYLYGKVLGVDFLVHSAAFLAILVGFELFAMSMMGRFIAWRVRRATVSDLRTALLAPALAFFLESQGIKNSQKTIYAIKSIQERMLS